MSDAEANMKKRSVTKNAPIYGRWDAEHGLGNCNKYKHGSPPWHDYESAYAKAYYDKMHFLMCESYNTESHESYEYGS